MLYPNRFLKMPVLGTTVALALLSVSLRITAAETAPTYAPLKPNEFMTSWLVLKPIPVSASTESEPDNQSQKKAFRQDLLAEQGGESTVRPHAGMKVKVAGQELEWTIANSSKDFIDLESGSKNSDHSLGYAWAEIQMPEKAKGILGIGSDDAVKVWLNGKKVHEKWVARAAQPDDDLIPVEFQRGTNQILLKIQNMKGEWGFFCRLMGPEAQAEKLIATVRRGDTDELKRDLDAGLDINSRSRADVTAWQAARLHGRTEVAAFLASRGADMKLPMPPPEKIVDRMLALLVKDDDAALSLLVSKDGKVLFEKGYGLADIEHHVSATPEPKFRIGSITKQFTASAILKLQEQGKLSVNDKLSKFIPDYPRGDEVTIHHLLTHTSGIHSYTGKPGFLDTVTSPVETLAHINSFKKDPYDFDPGNKWLYNNSGFFLLGYIIEKVSGQGYEDFLRKTFFEPLGMKDTGVHRSDLKLEHEALGYSFEKGEFKRALNWDMSRAGGAGSLYSTVEDLNRWNEGVFNGRVLGEKSLKAAFTPVKTRENQDDTSESGYGYGWAVGLLRGEKEISHGGGLNGFSTYLLRLPKENFTVTVLANASPGKPGVDPGQLSQLITEIYLGEKLQSLPALVANKTVSPSSFDALVGRYDYGNAILTVERQSDRLYAQLTGQPRFEIFPQSETNFFWKVADAQVTFIKNQQGTVTKAVHHQNGHTINAPKLEQPKEAKVDPASYDPLLGKYDYGEGKSVLTVTRDGDRLFAQLTGQSKYQIFPKSTNDFFWKIVDAQVTFVRDKHGKVTKAIHHQNGNTFDAPRIQ